MKALLLTVSALCLVLCLTLTPDTAAAGPDEYVRLVLALVHAPFGIQTLHQIGTADLLGAVVAERDVPMRQTRWAHPPTRGRTRRRR